MFSNAIVSSNLHKTMEGELQHSSCYTMVFQADDFLIVLMGIFYIPDDGSSCC